MPRNMDSLLAGAHTVSQSHGDATGVEDPDRNATVGSEVNQRRVASAPNEGGGDPDMTALEADRARVQPIAVAGPEMPQGASASGLEMPPNLQAMLGRVARLDRLHRENPFADEGEYVQHVFEARLSVAEDVSMAAGLRHSCSGIILYYLLTLIVLRDCPEMGAAIAECVSSLARLFLASNPALAATISAYGLEVPV
jgi:hypothetical protein